MRWLMSGVDPAAITAFLSVGSQASQNDNAVEEVADLRCFSLATGSPRRI
jgi:hypothetical protein